MKQQLHPDNRYFIAGKNILFAMMLFIGFANHVNAQCSYAGSESTSSISTPTCSAQVSGSGNTNGVGPGAYRYYSSTWTTNTWYSFFLSNPSATVSCAQAIFTNSSSVSLSAWANVYSTTGYLQAPANSFYILIETTGAANPNWVATSAQLTYQAVVPAASSFTADPTTVCQNVANTRSSVIDSGRSNVTIGTK